ncbi:MAG: Sulfotransfer 1 protein [Thermoleophilia bacterium]|nr:Sulfotransfer 1 protein [Thermoleophilia bacterium]
MRAAGLMLARARARTAVWRLTPWARARPTFLVIGAQKSGTTSLRRYLSGHPAVLCANPKELHFFNDAYHRGEWWYLAHFPWRTSALAERRRLGVRPAIGEATPAYLFHPRAAERVHAFDPQMKLVAVLRDPVERAYSQYQMQVRKRNETLSFDAVLSLEESDLALELDRIRDDPTYVSPTGLRRSYVARGRYAEQIELWLQFFPRAQLLVLTSEELLEDPSEVMSRVARFLGIPEHRADSYPLRGVRDYAPMEAATRKRLESVFEPHNRRLEELLGRELPWTHRTARDPAARAGRAS